MNGLLLHGNAWASVWAEVLWRASWQGGLALAVVWLIGLLLPKMPSGTRCWLWRIACLKLLLGCVWTPSLVLPLLPSPGASANTTPALETPSVRSIFPALLPPVPSPSSQVSIRNGGALSAPSSAPPRVPAALLALWMLGVGGRLRNTFLGWRRMRVLRSQCVPITEETQTRLLAEVGAQFRLRSVPQLCVGDVPTPLLMRVLRPAILLPTAVVREATRTELGWIMGHEAAHIQRSDMLWGWIFLLTRSVFFFHPMVWLTCAEWSLAQEGACDACVVQVMQAPRAEYGQMLVTLATQRSATVSASAPMLGVLQSYKALERRLAMLKHNRVVSPRQVRLASLFVGLSAVLCLTPWKVTAQNDTSPDRNVRLAQRWEDVLLLEATDYLRLSPQQYQEMLSLARFAHGRLADVAQQLEKTRARLEYLVQHQHEALVQGQSPSVSEQAEALELEQSLRTGQEPATEEIVRYVTPRLAHMLTRKQMQRVWLLAMGETPQGERRRAALLHPSSGFVLDEHIEFQWKQDQVSYALHQIYSDPVIEAAHRGNAAMQRVFGLLAQNQAGGQDGAQEPILPELSDEMREAVGRDEDAIRSRIGDTPDLYLDQAKPEQWEVVLRPLARRLFLSARLEPALTERLHKKN
jgi:beta-lactamase regulating signal transducer with metallopeptidase domain